MAKQQHVSYDKFSVKEEKVVVVEVPDAEKADPEEILEKVKDLRGEVGVKGEKGPKGPTYKAPKKGFPNCHALNVRKWPSTVANIVCVIDATVELVEDDSYEDEEWCKIFTVDGIEGYCMKKFIDFK